MTQLGSPLIQTERSIGLAGPNALSPVFAASFFQNNGFIKGRIGRVMGGTYSAIALSAMSTPARPNPRPKPPGQRRWPLVLVAAAAAGRGQDAGPLREVIKDAGLDASPAMTLVIKRKRPRISTGGRPFDPSIDDALEALLALCTKSG